MSHKNHNQCPEALGLYLKNCSCDYPECLPQIGERDCFYDDSNGHSRCRLRIGVEQEKGILAPGVILHRLQSKKYNERFYEEQLSESVELVLTLSREECQKRNPLQWV